MRGLLASVFLSCTSMLLQGAAVHAADTGQRKQQIQDIEKNATPAALARKRRSDALLRSEGVPVNDSLPAIEDETQVKHRGRDEVARRALALIVVSMKGGGVDETEVQKAVTDYQLSAHFSPAERAFMRNPRPAERERQQFSWRIEAAWVLLWSLGYVEELGKPTTECDVAAALAMMGQRDQKLFIAEAKLRPLADIVEQADRIYRYHWAVVDERIGGKPAGGLNADVVVERHYALNWLIGYSDQEWDDVSTDT